MAQAPALVGLEPKTSDFEIDACKNRRLLDKLFSSTVYYVDSECVTPLDDIKDMIDMWLHKIKKGTRAASSSFTLNTGLMALEGGRAQRGKGLIEHMIQVSS